jgi:hypothetical protein
VAQADLQASAEPQFSTLRQSASRLLGKQSPFRPPHFIKHKLSALLDIATKMREIISLNGTSIENPCSIFPAAGVARFSASPHLVMFGAAPPSAALHLDFNLQLLPYYLLLFVLTVLVYSRPGRLPDCQLVLGGMLCPSLPRPTSRQPWRDATLLSLSGF